MAVRAFTGIVTQVIGGDQTEVVKPGRQVVTDRILHPGRDGYHPPDAPFAAHLPVKVDERDQVVPEQLPVIHCPEPDRKFVPVLLVIGDHTTHHETVTIKVSEIRHDPGGHQYLQRPAVAETVQQPGSEYDAVNLDRVGDRIGECRIRITLHVEVEMIHINGPQGLFAHFYPGGEGVDRSPFGGLPVIAGVPVLPGQPVSARKLEDIDGLLRGKGKRRGGCHKKDDGSFHIG
jgi:hypothetical protein